MHAPVWSSWTHRSGADRVSCSRPPGSTRADIAAREPARRPVADPGSSHWLPYVAGLLVLGLALMSPLDAVGDGYLLSAHMGQHLLLSDVAPALLVLGLRAPVLPLGLPRGGLRLVAPGGRAGRVIATADEPAGGAAAVGGRDLGLGDPGGVRLLGRRTRSCTRSSTRRCSTPVSRCGG